MLFPPTKKRARMMVMMFFLLMILLSFYLFPFDGRSPTGSLRSDFRNPRLTSDFPAWISGIRGRRTARRGRIPKIGGGRRGRCLRFVKSRATGRLLLRLYGRRLVHDFSLQNNKKRRKKQLGEAWKQVAEGATL